MAKKTISKIAALALAGATVISTMSIVASAADELKVDLNGKLVGDVYKVVTTTLDANNIPVEEIVYYTTEAAAGANYTVVDVTTLGSIVYVKNGQVSKTNNGGTKYTTATSSASLGTTTHTIPTTNRYATDKAYYSEAKDTWYPNLDSLKAATGSTKYDAVHNTSNYSSTYCWFDPEEGYYYTEAQANGLVNAVYIPKSVTTQTTTDSTSVYKVGDRYYPTYSAAYSAAGKNANLIEWIRDYTTLPTNYFSNITGNFYTNYTSALAASNGKASDVVTFNDSYYDYYYNYLYGYDYYDYLYGYYNYDDPSYYYWLNKYYGSSSSSSKDTTTATVGNRKGWTSISNYLKKVSNGSSVTVDMNKETEVPSSVLSAIDGRNVTVKFVLDNGVTFTVNGKDVASAKDVELDTTYNTKNISNKLIKAAYKKNDAVSSAQISIDEGSFGFTSDVTVKFNTKRAGYKAKLYRYNSSKNTLSLVDSATIGNNGKCTFDGVTKGGEFLIVLYK